MVTEDVRVRDTPTPSLTPSTPPLTPPRDAHVLVDGGARAQPMGFASTASDPQRVNIIPGASQWPQLIKRRFRVVIVVGRGWNNMPKV